MWYNLTVHQDFDRCDCRARQDVVDSLARENGVPMLPLEAVELEVVDNDIITVVHQMGIKGLIDQDGVVTPPGHIWRGPAST